MKHFLISRGAPPPLADTLAPLCSRVFKTERRRQICGLLLLLCNLIALTIVRAADDSAPAEMLARVENAQSPNRQGLDGYTLRQVMDRFHVPGVSVAVIKDFEIHWAKGYGVADVESGAAVETNTLFQAASISKPVAAMAVVRAVQDGRFSLDDDINTILTSWKLPDSELTRGHQLADRRDRKSTRLNSSHDQISYAVF